MADLKIALAIDANNPVAGDLYLDATGNCRLTNSLSEDVAQELWIRLHFFQGEWFLDTTVGIPYFQSILGQKTPTGIIEQMFRRVITTCPGVASLDSFLLTSLPARRISIAFACTLQDGAVLTSADFAPFIVGAP